MPPVPSCGAPVYWYSLEGCLFACYSGTLPPEGAQLLGLSLASNIEDDWLVVELFEARAELYAAGSRPLDHRGQHAHPSRNG